MKNETTGGTWISVEEAMPEEFVSVQAHMTDAGPFPSVREAFHTQGKWYFPALWASHPVDMWQPFAEPSEAGTDDHFRELTKMMSDKEKAPCQSNPD